MASRNAPADERPDDVEISASVRARTLRFAEKPQAVVEFDGDPEDSESRSERENLPDEVEPGVSYHDVTVRWRARARAIEREG